MANLKFDEYNYTLPVWAICPIVNDDYTGITEEDEEYLNAFLDTLPSGSSTWEFPEDTDCEKYFSYRNDVDNLGGDVVDAILWVRVD